MLSAVYSCGKSVHGLCSGCGAFAGLSPALPRPQNFVGTTTEFIQVLSNFCTQFVHTTKLIFTPVIDDLSALCTAPIIMTTSLIKE